jgi:serine/threonine protein kinase
MISHPNIVKLVEVLASHTKIYLVLELVEGSDLFDKINKRNGLPEELCREYFRQIIAGVEHCHKQGVCHRDLKPENILIHSTDNVLKISDFGLSSLCP